MFHSGRLKDRGISDATVVPVMRATITLYYFFSWSEVSALEFAAQCQTEK